jgi:hypothetical protein
MPSIDHLGTFLAGLGVGGGLTALVQYWLSRRGKREDSRFAARKAAFDGLMVAYAALEEGWSEARAKQFALWEAQVQLHASSAVVVALKSLKASQPKTPERRQAHDDLIEAMRSDLVDY